MFGWRKRQIAEQVEKDVADTDPYVAPEPKPKHPEVCWQVGRTDDNRISLRIGDSSYYSTLLMNSAGVLQLIKVLEASLDEVTEEDDHEDSIH